MLEKEQLATLGEYSNYFSEGLFVELTEPLFVKKNWVPQWLWSLVSESRLSYFEFDRRNTKLSDDNSIQITSKETVAQAIEYLKTPEGGLAFVKSFNDSVNDPNHLIDNKGDS